MSNRLAAVALALLTLGPGPAPLDSEAAPRPYVVTSWSGSFFFKMTPDPSAPANREKGLGFAYKVTPGQTDELLWQTNGWYSFSVWLSDDGVYLVRVGNWPRGDKPTDSDLAVAFYKSGELLKKYSTADLIKDPSRIAPSVSHYDFLAAPFPDFAEQPTVPRDKLTFRLRTVDAIEYLFDARTGELLSATQF